MKILSKEIIADTGDTKITRFTIFSPEIAQKSRPGQFVILMVSEKGERIPLTLVDADEKKGVITLIVQEVGYTTRLLGRMNPGDSLYSLVGPLGHPTLIENYGRVIMVGGGVGIAELLPIARALKQKGNTIYSILGARTKELLILRNEVASLSDKFYLTTNDGSLGEKGFVSMVLERILSEDSDFQLVYCVGPLPMMRAIAEITRPFGIKTLVCLNTIMLDGTGMCGSCRLNYDGRIKFCCVDGPDFDAHLVDFEDLMNRQKRFLEEEKKSLTKPTC